MLGCRLGAFRRRWVRVRHLRSSGTRVTGKARHRVRKHRRIQPYAWLGAGALTFGVGVALASGSAVAHADSSTGAADHTSSGAASSTGSGASSSAAGGAAARGKKSTAVGFPAATPIAAKHASSSGFRGAPSSFTPNSDPIGDVQSPVPANTVKALARVLITAVGLNPANLAG